MRIFQRGKKAELLNVKSSALPSTVFIFTISSDKSFHFFAGVVTRLNQKIGFFRLIGTAQSYNDGSLHLQLLPKACFSQPVHNILIVRPHPHLGSGSEEGEQQEAKEEKVEEKKMRGCERDSEERGA